MVVAPARAAAGFGAVEALVHVRKLSAREPGDLVGVCEQQQSLGVPACRAQRGQTGTARNAGP